MAAEKGRTGRVHAVGIPAKQRAHVAALLIVLLSFTAPLCAQSDIEFDPGVTQEEFATFSRLIAQGIYATPVDAARARGLLGFDIGLASTAVPVDPQASYWVRSTGGDDFSYGDHLVVPRLVASKGLSIVTVSGMYSAIPGTDIKTLGGSLDVPIISGGVLRPTLALRGAYSTLQGVDDFDLQTYGAELFLSKGFGPITPYAAVGMARSDAEGRVQRNPLSGPVTFVLTDQSNTNRITVGVKLSLLIPKIVVEATQGEVRSYAAKVSFGL